MNRKERDTGSVGRGWGAVDAGGSGRGSPIAQEEEFYFSPMDVGGHGRVLSNRITFLPCLGWHCPPLAEAPAQSTPQSHMRAGAFSVAAAHWLFQQRCSLPRLSPAPVEGTFFPAISLGSSIAHNNQSLTTLMRVNLFHLDHPLLSPGTACSPRLQRLVCPWLPSYFLVSHPRLVLLPAGTLTIL